MRKDINNLKNKNKMKNKAKKNLLKKANHKQFRNISKGSFIKYQLNNNNYKNRDYKNKTLN